MKIGFCGITLNSINYGVSALAISQISLIDGIVNELGIRAEYVVFSMDEEKKVQKLCEIICPEKEVHIHSSARFKTGLKGLVSLKKAICECDIIFDLTKGDSFSDIYGYKRFLLQDIEKRLAIKYSRLFISPQTIGPFNSSFSKHEAKYALEKSISVFARDEKSKECVAQLTQKVQTTVTSDLAFYLPYTKSEKFSSHSDKTYVGINISGLLWNGGYTGKNEFGLKCDYQKYTREMIRNLHECGDYEIILLAHVFMDGGDDDYRVCEALQKEFPFTRLAPYFFDPIEAKSFMTKLDYLIGARMHATIGAISSGTVVIPFSYSRKFEGLYYGIDYPFVIEATKWDTHACISFTMNCITQEQELDKRADTAVQNALKKNEAYYQSAKTIIESLSAKE